MYKEMVVKDCDHDDFMNGVLVCRNEDTSLEPEIALPCYKQIEKDIRALEDVTRKKTLIFQAYNCKRSFCQNLDLLKPPKEFAESKVDKAKFLKTFPRSYILFSTISLLLCPLIGILAVWHATKAEEAVHQLNFYTARKSALKAFRYGILGICYGMIFGLSFVIILVYSTEFQRRLFLIMNGLFQF